MKYCDAIPRLIKETPAFIYNTRGSHSLNTNRILSKKLYQKNIMTIMDSEYRGTASDGAIIEKFNKIQREKRNKNE